MARIGLKTVRAKLIATTMLVIAVVVAALGFTVDFAARRTMLGVIDRDLQLRGDDLVRNMERGGGQMRGPGPGPNGPGMGGGRGPGPGSGEFRGPGGFERRQSPRSSRIGPPVVLPLNQDPNDLRPREIAIDPAAQRTAPQKGPHFTTVVIDNEPRRVYTTVFRRDGRVESVIQLSYPLGEVLDSLAGLRQVLVTVVLPTGLLLAGLAGLFVVGRLLNPLRRLTTDAERIGGGTLSERLQVSGEDEFAGLATTLNGMLGRIEQNFEQQRRFTADASHELKTPLAVIKANVGIVRHGKPTAEEVKESAEAIDLAADRMSALVRDLLVLARADAGRASSAPVSCNWNEIVRGAIRSVPNSERVVLFAPDEAVPVTASPEDLTRALVNLLDNALKYSEADSSVQVAVRIEGEAVAVTMTDQGPGIAPEHLEHLFERFYRPDQSRTSASGGTGLGLAIAKGIVEMHGGTIGVRSEVGKGTTVEVRLPITRRTMNA